VAGGEHPAGGAEVGAVAGAGGGLLALVGDEKRPEGEARAADEGAVVEMVGRSEVGDAHHLSGGARALLGGGGIGSARPGISRQLHLLPRGQRRKRGRERWRRCGGGRGIGAELCGEGFEVELGLAKAAGEEGVVVGGGSKLPVEGVAKLRGEREHQRRRCCDGDGGLWWDWAIGVGFGDDGKSREELRNLRRRRRRRRWQRRGAHWRREG